MTTEAQMREQFEQLMYEMYDVHPLPKYEGGDYHNPYAAHWTVYQSATEQMKPLVNALRSAIASLEYAVIQGLPENSVIKHNLAKGREALANLDEQELKNARA